MSDKKDGDKKEKITTFRQLADLWGKSVELDLPDPKTLAPDDLVKQAEIIDAGQQKVQEWTKNLLTKVDQRAMAVNTIEDRNQKRIAQKLAQDDNATDLKALDSFLHGDRDPFYRQAAWFATLEYFFSGDLQTTAELATLLERMVAANYLTKDAAGPLKPYKDGYNFCPDCPLDEAKKTKVKLILLSLRTKIFDYEKTAIKEKGNLEIQGFLAGKPGKLCLNIHAEPIRRGEQTFWRNGGVLLVESDGKRIKPLDATGGIEMAVKEAKEMNVFLIIDSLRHNNPPWVESLSREMNGKCQLLWHLMRRGLFRYELEAMATVTPEEFFLKQELGDCFLEFKGTWQVPNGPTIANFFFLVRREEEEGARRICITKAPSHLEDFFAQCLGKYEEGNKFENVPQPLKAVLQAAYGQVRYNAEKTAQIAK